MLGRIGVSGLKPGPISEAKPRSYLRGQTPDLSQRPKPGVVRVEVRSELRGKTKLSGRCRLSGMSLELFAIDPPLRLRPETPMSDEEFMRFCAANEPNQFELDGNGEIIVMSPTGSAGGGAELDVGVELGIWARADGRGKVFGPSAGFKLPDGSVRAPDASLVSWAKWNALTAEQQKGFAPICPEFVIEIRSETDRLATVQAKMQMWVANGAEVAWLLDPIERSVTVYRPGEEAERLNYPTSVQGTGPVAGFELVLARVWSEERG